MDPFGDLPFVVDLWSEDELHVEKMLSCAATLSVARMAFDTAALTFPNRLITLCGPGVDEERPAENIEYDDISKDFSARLGLTSSPTRLLARNPGHVAA